MAKAKSDFRIRTGYEPVERCGKVCEGADLTKQSFKEDCDINVLVARFQRAGVLPPSPGEQPKVYADVSAYDFQEFSFIVAQARQMFAQLPAELRYRFGNDPQRMLEFLDKPENAAEAVKLGLMAPAGDQAWPAEPADPAELTRTKPEKAPEAPKTNSIT